MSVAYRMNPWINVALDGWMGKVLFSAVAFTIAWFSRRPAERASLLLAVDKRVETAMAALERQLQAAHDRCDALTSQHEQCEARLSGMREEIDALMRGGVPPDWTNFAPTYKRPKP